LGCGRMAFGCPVDFNFLEQNDGWTRRASDFTQNLANDLEFVRQFGFSVKIRFIIIVEGSPIRIEKVLDVVCDDIERDFVLRVT